LPRPPSPSPPRRLRGGEGRGEGQMLALRPVSAPHHRPSPVQALTLSPLRGGEGMTRRLRRSRTFRGHDPEFALR
jgi:hypothetical protein